MDEFPFSEADWKRVGDTTSAICNATYVSDGVLHASCVVELQHVLEDLRHRYGEHPTLLETEADFLIDPSLQLKKYREAIRLAVENLLRTWTIRLSLASVLLGDFANARQAKIELTACELKIENEGSEFAKNKWHELMDKCNELL